MKSFLLCGVGGQGTVLASRIIASAAMKNGLFARTAETIGMAQRGGSVVSHVRVGDAVPSPMIPPAGADVIIGFEPGETVRCLPYLKQGGTVIVCDREIEAVAAGLAGFDYNGADMVAYLKSCVKNTYVIETQRVISECGSDKVINMVLVGALAALGLDEIKIDFVNAAMSEKVKPQFIEINEKALSLGAKCIGGNINEND